MPKASTPSPISQPGHYRVRFDGLPSNRAFTLRSAGSDPTIDSDVDPTTGLTPIFSLSQGAPNLVPAADVGVTGVDYVNQAISAGLVGSYSIGDTVWRDVNGDGLLDPGDAGIRGVAVQLLSLDGQVIDATVTSRSGRFTFSGLPAGAIGSSSPVCPRPEVRSVTPRGQSCGRPRRRSRRRDSGHHGGRRQPRPTPRSTPVSPPRPTTAPAPGGGGERFGDSGGHRAVQHGRRRTRDPDQWRHHGSVRRRLSADRAPSGTVRFMPLA